MNEMCFLHLGRSRDFVLRYVRPQNISDIGYVIGAQDSIQGFAWCELDHSTLSVPDSLCLLVFL